MTQYFPTILNDSPLAYWRLDELFGINVRDDTPQRNDGTLHAPFTLHAPGAVNPSFSNSIFFGGSNDGTTGGYISIPSALSTTGLPTLTVECWVNLADLVFTSNPRLIANSHTGTDKNGFELWIAAGGASATLSVGNGTTQHGANIAGSLSASTWYHLVGVYDGSHIQMYLNGHASGAAVAHTGTLSASGFPVNLARNPAYTADYLHGALDEVALYQAALTPTQILAHYRAGVNGTTGPWNVTISRSLVAVQAGTLNVDSAISRQGIASFFVKQPDTGTHYQQYEPVAIYDPNCVLYYSGYINLPKEQKPGFQNTLLTYITCMDQTWLAKKRVVFDTGTTLAKIYLGKPYDYIIADIVNLFLAAEGVTIGQIYGGPYPSGTFGTALYPSSTLYPSGPLVLIPSATFNFPYVSDVLDALAKAASVSGVTYYWYIDKWKRLYFLPYAATTGPAIDFTLIDQSGRKPPYVQRANPLYYNTQYIVGGTDGTAQQTFSFVGDGSLTSWTLPLGVVNRAPFVWINGDAQSVGKLNVDPGRQFYWSPGSAVLSAATAPASGAQGFVWYQPQVPTNANVQNATEVAAQKAIDETSGIIESVVKDTTIVNLSDGLAEGNANLARDSVRGQLFVFTTKQTGFVPGQQVGATYTPFAYSGTQFLVENVHVDDSDGLNVWTTVSVIIGPYDQTWSAFFGKALKTPPPQTAQSINIGV